VPDVAESSLFPTQSSGLGRPEVPTPVSDGFVGDKDSSLGEQVFYVSKAQGEPVASIECFHPLIVADWDMGLTHSYQTLTMSIIQPGFNRSALTVYYHHLTLKMGDKRETKIA